MSESLLDQSIAAERLALAALWLNGEAGHDAACDVGLTGRDWCCSEHSFLFCYILKSVELTRKLDLFEASRLAAECGLNISVDDLADVVLSHHRKDKLADYLRAVAFLAREREQDECRAVARDALRDNWVAEYTEWRRRRVRNTENI